MFNPKIKILITGGFGFIGTNLTLKLLELGYQVEIIDNLNPQIHSNKFHFLMNDERVNYYIDDIRNEFLLSSLIKQSDVIVHLASDTGTNQSENEIHRYTDNNICGTSKILDILNNNKHKVKKLILASSRAIYGEGTNKKETDQINPKSIYGITKEVQEKLIINSSPVDYTILRFQNVYGPFQSLTNPYTGILSIFFSKMIKNKPIEIYDNNKATRDFIYISDVVDAISLSIIKENINTIFNVGTSKEFTILLVAESIKKIINSRSEIIVNDFHRKGDVLNVSADISKIKNCLNWVPIIELENGLNKFIEWAKEQSK